MLVAGEKRLRMGRVGAFWGGMGHFDCNAEIFSRGTRGAGRGGDFTQGEGRE